MWKANRVVALACAALLLAGGIGPEIRQPASSGAEPSGDTGKRPGASAKKEKEAWKNLFDGKSLAGWKEIKFGGEGDVAVTDGAIVMEQGNDMTGITYDRGDLPKMNYEITLEGKKLKGNDFFCTTTFPVGDAHCSLVIGGWGGGVVGLSTLDGKDASENETGTLQTFTKDRWYHVKIRVTTDRITAWIDDKQVVDVDTKGKKISIRPECDLCRPLGIATWRTVGAVRDIRVRPLSAVNTKN
jgi:hypothetical protein